MPQDGAVHVARTDGAIVGSAFCATRSEVTYLWGCYVRRSMQGRGVGTALLAATVDPAARGTFITAMTASEGTVAFYTARGFRVVGRTEHALVPDRPMPALEMFRPNG